ncbi:MAG: hypothetical protein M1827_002876 [Pycnora praestabilis]|nr:MAG: hypothetical protein M1827_002876 [Pycnora praestabilis]
MSIPNVWHLRRVAETSSKACDICYKPTTTVLITPDKRDFFYICPGHLKDKGFCSPIIDEAAVAAKKKEEMDREVERLKKEFEEKQRKKKDKERSKDKEKDDKKDGGDKEKPEQSKDETSSSTPAAEDTTVPKVDEAPRIFALHKSFHQKRIDRLRNAEIVKRNRERLKSPTAFPTVPMGDL